MGGVKLIDKKVELAKWLLDPDKEQVFPHDLKFLENRLTELDLEKIYREIELPLVEVLEKMHELGIKVDVNFLSKLSREQAKELKKLAKDIYKKTGAFNLNSPKQLGEVLFDKLKIDAAGVPRTKTGAYSTDVGVLSAIKGRYPVVDLILKYREIFKIKSTYVEPLLELADANGRVHTSFVQTGTATGRLSSQNPNLQNVPMELRPAFITEKGWALVSFDYSQIELRVLASVAGDPKMIEAFNNDLDIHSLTAAQVFNIAVNKVTKEQRQFAKTLNFGVIYGMGPNAFAAQSGLSRAEAEKFIREYFADFAEVKRWQEKTIAKARQLGYVENLNGRKRWLPSIASPNRRISSGAERAAINMPIQGLAADIIKLAMLKVPKSDDIHLLLSIHDELVFEIKKGTAEKAAEEIKKIMENVYQLAVPLKVDVTYGRYA